MDRLPRRCIPASFEGGGPPDVAKIRGPATGEDGRVVDAPQQDQHIGEMVEIQVVRANRNGGRLIGWANMDAGADNDARDDKGGRYAKKFVTGTHSGRLPGAAVFRREAAHR